MIFRRVFFTVAVSLLTVTAFAADEPDSFIYKSGSLSQDGLLVGGWGSGRAAESKEKSLGGAYSIKITTQGLYAGGRIDLPQPVTLFTDKPEAGRYLQFAFCFDEMKKVDPSAGTNNEVSVDSYMTSKAAKVRFVFVSDKGEMTSVEQLTSKLEDENWMRVSIPLSRLKLPAGETEYRLARLMIFTDVPSTLYMGEMKLTSDTTSLEAAIDCDSPMFGLNTKMFFLANVESGLATAVYSWDFDNSDGIQAESTGLVGSHVFDTPGNYVVTLTATDRDGVKAPATAIFKVEVNEE